MSLFLDTARKPLAMDTVRRRVLKVHAAFLLFLGFFGVMISTAGWALGTGHYAFLQDNETRPCRTHPGILVGDAVRMVLWLGSKQPTPVIWNLVGGGANLCILGAYVLHWNLLGSLGPETPILRNVVVCVHIGLVLLTLGGVRTPRAFDQSQTTGSFGQGDMITQTS
jgi:hypothetical protein